MNDVGGSESGTGLRPKSSRGSASDTNFEYDDSEWDVGIGNLIIDLDADIEKNNEANRNTSATQQPTSTSSATASVTSQMHIPPTSSSATSSSNSNMNTTKTSKSSGNTTGHSRTVSNSSSGSLNSPITSGGSESIAPATGKMEHSSTCTDKGLKMKIKRTKPGTKSVEAKHEIVKNEVNNASSSSNTASSNASQVSGTTKIVGDSASHDVSSKVFTSPMCSNKCLKDKTGGVDDKYDGQTNATDPSNKLKNTKRVPPAPQKKIRIGGNSTSLTSTSQIQSIASQSNATTVGPKKETIGTGNDFRVHTPAVSNKNIAPAAIGSIVSPSNNTNSTITIPSVSSTIASAFVKATPIKVPTQQQCANLSGMSQSQESSSHITSGNLNQQSLKNTNNSGSFGLSHASNSNSPSKDRLTNSASGSNGAPTEKGLQVISNTHVKRPKMFSQHQEKNTDGSKLAVTTGTSGASIHSNNQNYSSGTDFGTSKEIISSIDRASSQNEQISHDVCVGTSIGTVTEPDCLGPCEPGTSVTLEGIVWHETENGVLVVNVTWRGKTYVGTLLDCTKNEWASPRFCESPTSDMETRTPKNRAKRGRAQGSGTPVLEINPSPLDALRVSATKLRNGAKGRRGSSTLTASFLTPVSPIKVDPWPKRKTRGSENETQDENSSSASKSTKRLKIGSKDSSGYPCSGSPVPGIFSSAQASGSISSEIGPYSPALIECPEPNCSKKYKHINGLKYHQSHAHTSQFTPAEDSDSNMSTTSASNMAVGTSNIDGASEPEPLNCDEVEPATDISKSTDEVELNPGAISLCDESSSSAPTTPLKTNSKVANEEEVNDLNITDDSENHSAVLLPLPLTKEKIPPRDNENDGKSNETREFHSSHVHPNNRTPILTVPSFVSLQSRPAPHQSISMPRIGPPPSQDLPSISSESQKLDKTSKSISVPWQPHASTNSSSFQSSSTIISPVHSNAQTISLSIPSPTNGSKNSGPALCMKKSKHKKKSKDKRDRDRDGKSKSSGDSSRKDGDGLIPNIFSNSNAGKREERKSSNDTLGDDGEGKARLLDHRDRDDPQSPAYSDISDANDSGPESDLGGGNKEVIKINSSGGSSEQAKDLNSGIGGAHSFSSFYSPGLYSPYSLGENPPGSVIGMPMNTSLNKNADPKSEDSSPGKTKATGSAGSLQNHPHTLLQGLPNERLSPKMDFHPKYLPQQYYSYPYSNFHGFEQSPYGLLPENPYSAHNRAFIEEKERELQMEQLRKSKSGEIGKDSSVGMPAATHVKQEPTSDRERSHKESTIGKSQVPSNPDSSKRSASFGTTGCSKHPKEYNRRSEKEDRDRERHTHNFSSNNSKSESLGHKGNAGTRNSGHHHADRERQSGRHTEDNLDKEKDREKIEGSKPTMETTGPPPPPTGSYAYIPPSYLQSSPFGLPFDTSHPLYRQVIVPGPYPGPPYSMHPGNLPRFPPTSVSTPLPEDLSRPSPAASVPVPASKALDLLQHHAAQYYATHKIHELQERALKSPSPQVSASNSQPTPTSGAVQLGNISQSSKPSSPSGTAPAIRKEPATTISSALKGEVTKDVKPSLTSMNIPIGSSSDSSRSPPTQHHVHSHTHHHTHIGYPIIPAVAPQYSPHYPHVIPPTGAPTPVIPPFTPQKPTS